MCVIGGRRTCNARPYKALLMPPSDEGGAPKGRRERTDTYSLFTFTYYFKRIPQSASLTAPFDKGAMRVKRSFAISFFNNYFLR